VPADAGLARRRPLAAVGEQGLEEKLDGVHAGLLLEVGVREGLEADALREALELELDAVEARLEAVGTLTVDGGDGADRGAETADLGEQGAGAAAALVAAAVGVGAAELGGGGHDGSMVPPAPDVYARE
jgi:hypothetical protein